MLLAQCCCQFLCESTCQLGCDAAMRGCFGPQRECCKDRASIVAFSILAGVALMVVGIVSLVLGRPVSRLVGGLGLVLPGALLLVGSGLFGMCMVLDDFCNTCNGRLRQ